MNMFTRQCLVSTRRLISAGKNLLPSNRITLQRSRAVRIFDKYGYAGAQHALGYSTAAATESKPDMFCYQCEQTKSRKGCVTVGVCGKTSQVSALQDLLMYTLQGLATFVNRGIKMGVPSYPQVDDFMMKAMFSTMTNVNFDHDRFPVYIKQAIQYRDEAKAALEKACRVTGNKMDPALERGPSAYTPESYGIPYLEEEGNKVGVLDNKDIYGEDLNGVRYMVMYGIRGMSAYASHAASLGQVDENVAKDIYETLDFMTTGPEEERHDLVKNLGLALKIGETNIRVMELLDKGHREQLGVPSPTTVTTTPKEGPCILVSGHDNMDLLTILKFTEGTGINVYTHGEMLPGHSYPKLREYKHLAGHFGSAWQNQKMDFGAFPGPVITTTNCVIEPLNSYRDRLYTVNETGLHNVKHVSLHDGDHVKQLIEHAKSLKGFDQKMASKYPDRKPVVGFGREVLIDNAGTVLKAVEEGTLQRIFLIGGCDGSEHKRNYFHTLAENLPKETLILTMGCAKFRINDIDFGNLGDTGIPRLLDMGQCNDSYGAVVVAQALADALNTDVNSLPLSLSLSWFEQKAVAVLLSLLHLGVKNIRLGPVMPAFMTPKVRQILSENYGLTPTDIRNPLDDMAAMSK